MFDDTADTVITRLRAQLTGGTAMDTTITLANASVVLASVGMDIKPGDGSAWYSIRLLFGRHHGRWSFLKAYHELPAQGPVGTEASGWYRAVAERALVP